MDETSFLYRIRELYDDLKGSEKRVAEYILKNPQKIIQCSITELSEICNSGEATIFRVCKKLGYKGYQELKIKIASEVVTAIEDIHEEIKEDDTSLMVVQKIFNANIHSLNETLKINDINTFNEATSIIVNSNKLIFFGMGGSAAIAYDAYHKFIRTGKQCEFNPDSHFQAMLVANSNENDCIIAISNTGSNKELIDNLYIAKEKGLKIIAITANSKSPISKVADVVIVSYGNENTFKSEAMESRISALCIIDCLFVGTCLEKQEDYSKSLKNIRAAIAKKRF